LADARQKAEAWRGLVLKGIDPKEAEAEERRKLEAARRAEAMKRENTFGAFAERWIAGRTNRHAKADAADVRRMLIPTWQNTPLHELTPRDVRELFAKLVRRSPHDARSAWGHATQIFKLAVHEEAITASPMASLDKKLVFAGVNLAPRQRVLDDVELFALWRGAGRLPHPAGPFYQLLLLTGCRKNEIGKAKWSELHPEVRRAIRDANVRETKVDWRAVPATLKVLVVPRERFKSDSEHRVQLTDDALRIIEGLPRFAKCDYLFSVTGKSAVWVGEKFKERLEARMLRTLRALARKRGDDPTTVKLAPWVNHDLRRVVKTNMGALKVPDQISELVLGHGKKGLRKIYDQHEYGEDIREALERWAERLRGIVEPAPVTPPVAGNVIRFRGARG
jgi:integrase